MTPEPGHATDQALGFTPANGRANGVPPPGTPMAPSDVLETARIDLVAYLRNGIPERRYVPGCHGMLAAGKRHHVTAARKTGKSIAFGIVTAVDVVEAGGTVAVLDRENGRDEYARRLDDVLKARTAAAELVDAVQARFRYYDWPTVNLAWGKNAAYPEAFAGVDLVIFDSSRAFLTSVGLEENLSDDYSKFVEGLLSPLVQYEIATLVLDNTGHDAKERPRGTSSKEDLADVAFTLKVLVEFNKAKAGRLELAKSHSRLGEIQGRWTMELGGGSYGTWERPDEDRKEMFRLIAVESLVELGPMGRDELIKTTRARGAKGRNETLRAWLSELSSDPTSGLVKTTDGYAPEGWPRSAGHPGAMGPQPTSSDPLAPGPLPTGARGERGHPSDLAPGSGHPFDPDWRPYRPVNDDDEPEDERKDLA